MNLEMSRLMLFLEYTFFEMSNIFEGLSVNVFNGREILANRNLIQREPKLTVSRCNFISHRLNCF